MADHTKLAPIPYILKGNIFHVRERIGDQVLVECVYCPANKKLFRGYLRQGTSNWHKHIRVSRSSLPRLSTLSTLTFLYNLKTATPCSPNPKSEANEWRKKKAVAAAADQRRRRRGRNDDHDDEAAKQPVEEDEESELEESWSFSGCVLYASRSTPKVKSQSIKIGRVKN